MDRGGWPRQRRGSCSSSMQAAGLAGAAVRLQVCARMRLWRGRGLVESTCSGVIFSSSRPECAFGTILPFDQSRGRCTVKPSELPAHDQRRSCGPGRPAHPPPTDAPQASASPRWRMCWTGTGGAPTYTWCAGLEGAAGITRVALIRGARLLLARLLLCCNSDWDSALPFTPPSHPPQNNTPTDAGAKNTAARPAGSCCSSGAAVRLGLPTTTSTSTTTTSSSRCTAPQQRQHHQQRRQQERQ